MPSVFVPSSHTAATHRFLGWGWSAGIGIAVGTGGDVPSVTEGTTTVVDTKTLSTINDKMAKLEAENKAIKEKNEALQKRMDEILAKLSAK